jgi:hypothetical protein
MPMTLWWGAPKTKAKMSPMTIKAKGATNQIPNSVNRDRHGRRVGASGGWTAIASVM